MCFFVIYLLNLNMLLCEFFLCYFNKNKFLKVEFNDVLENFKVICVICFDFLL